MSAKNLFLKPFYIYPNHWIITSIILCQSSLDTTSSTIKLCQGRMCRVLHMARCTNVIRLGHLALRSGVASGWWKTFKM